MNSKIFLLSVAVISVGLFALPQTMSLFSGQHTWKSLEDANFCRKCHEDIYEEITSPENQVHTSAEMQACEGCHRTANFSESGANITYGEWKQYRSDNTLLGEVNVTAHAAVTVECLACHGLNDTTYGTNKSITGVAAEIQGSSEAHRNFYYSSVSDKPVGDINQTSLGTANIRVGPTWYATGTYNQTAIKLKGTNTACIGCHTHAIVNITWERSTGYDLVVESDTSTGKLNITTWSINQSTNITYTSSE